MSHVVDLASPEALSQLTVGGKGVNLARMAQAGFHVPPGFVVTTSAYAAFIEQSGLGERIAAILSGLDAADQERLESSTVEIRGLIAAATVTDEVTSMIAQAYGALDGAPFVAVRSSGTAEDLEGTSFAGMHDTYLDVRGAGDVIGAVKRCWASLWTARATAYRADHGFASDSIGIAVVVQEMVQSEVSGVMFTGNPLNDATDEIVINASWGLGEAIVQGIATPDNYIVKWHDLHIRDQELGGKEVEIVRAPDGAAGVIEREVSLERRDQFTLSCEQAMDLADLGRRVTQYYEMMPQDIEWAFARGEFFLLQSRPITGVEFSWDADVDDWYTLPEADGDYWSRTWSDEGWTGAITPLMYSWRAPSWIAGHDPSTRLWGFDKELNSIRMWKYHKGEAYWNLRKEMLYTELTYPPVFRALKVTSHLPDTMQAEVDSKKFDWMQYFKLYARMNLFRPQQDRLWGWMKYFDSYYFTEMVEYADGPSADELRRMTDKELKKTVLRYKEFEDNYNAVFWTGAFIYIRDAMCLLLWMMRNWYGEGADQAYLELMSGSTKRTPTVIENHTLWNLAQKIKNSDELSSAMAEFTGEEFFRNVRGMEAGEEFIVEYDAFVAESGHRGHADRDVCFTRRVEDPGIDYNPLQSFLDVEQDPFVREVEVNARRDQVIDEVVARLKRGPLGFLRAEAVKVVVDWIHRFIVFRDTERNCIDRSTFTIKRCFLEANARLIERGLVASDRDFWFLTVDELWTLLQSGAVTKLTRAKIESRMRNWDRFHNKEVQMPMYIHKGQPVDLDHPDDEGEEGVLRGSGTSSGVVTGVACVVKSLAELGRLKPGEILVCNSTDPGWAAGFNIIAAIVTETGGPLAHAACLAREYGMPSAQIKNAVTLIPDGATITVDGVSGRVTIVSPPVPADVAEPELVSAG
ncbi:MAG: PEP/pyruvate-binding domain-containing protein [Solirubrobacteraceae bacterium]